MYSSGIDGIENSYIYPLPRKLALLNARDIRERLEAGENPFALSLEKWTRIRNAMIWVSTRALPDKYMHNFKDKIGYTTCSLCLRAMEKHKRIAGTMHFKRDKCKFCPLEKIDCCIDEDSIFRKIDQQITLIEREMALNVAKAVNEVVQLCDKMCKNIDHAATL